MTAKKSTSDVKAPKGEITMAELLAGAKNRVQQFTKGQRVMATILSKSPESVITGIHIFSIWFGIPMVWRKRFRIDIVK